MGIIRPGRRFGVSNTERPLFQPRTPADLSATILNHLGIDHRQVYEDDFQHLRNHLSQGRVVKDLT